MTVLIMLPMRFSHQVWGLKGMYLWTLAFVGSLTLFSLRSLVINRNPFQIGMVFYCVIITAGVVAAALGWLPPTLGNLPIALASCVYLVVLSKRPVRMDYSLFLRAAQKLFPRQIESALPPVAAKLTRTEILAFARFLGTRWLVVNYRWESVGLGLQLSPVKASFANRMLSINPFMSQRESCLVLRRDGTVLAICSDGDAEELNTQRDVAPADLESLVCVAVQQAWREFRAGNLERAEQLLGERCETEVLVVPLARSDSTRWLRVGLGASIGIMLLSMVVMWRNQRLSFVSGRHLQPVSCTEAEVRASLALLRAGGLTSSNAWRRLEQAWWPMEVLPPLALFGEQERMEIPARLLAQSLPRSASVSERGQYLLSSKDLLRAQANGWPVLKMLGLTQADLRGELPAASRQQLKMWFEPRESRVQNHDGQALDYQVLLTEELAYRVLVLKRLDCLNAVDGAATTELLLKQQVRSGQTPTGRRVLPYPALLNGLFVTLGSDPIQDTYQALVVLDAFGALERVDREACVRGILRFHHGRGLFGSVRQGDGFVIFGDSRDTFWAFESLRLLGALDRVTDLSQWQFRAQFHFRDTNHPADTSNLLSWPEIEAWVCQQRLERIICQRKENPGASIRSLLEP